MQTLIVSCYFFVSNTFSFHQSLFTLFLVVFVCLFIYEIAKNWDFSLSKVSPWAQKDGKLLSFYTHLVAQRTLFNQNQNILVFLWFETKGYFIHSSNSDLSLFKIKRYDDKTYPKPYKQKLYGEFLIQPENQSLLRD